MKHIGQVKVWDPFVRIFHWGLVTAFAVAYITEEDFLDLHTLAGYLVLGLLLLRLLWGFIGTPHARFKDFSYTPAAIKKFLADTLRLRAQRYLGHNPAASAMIYLLLLSLLLTVFSGLAVYGIEGSGPFAIFMAGAGDFFEEALEEVHEFFANFSLMLVLLHVAGVVVSSLIEGENLVRAMVTGHKKDPGEAVDRA
mgnify:CR=1 FL=1